ncbi:hypothetical protein J4Q44_G00282420 [Coregonus suidteri]|uniref:Uncharacterized protein n=1 Tax=Coregonus suidteri TaxID=861788 RepID=A0AAN8KSF2_9TELE
MPDTVLEGGGVLDSPETEQSPEGPSTGPSPQAFLTNTQRTVQAHPCSLTSNSINLRHISPNQLQRPEEEDC